MPVQITLDPQTILTAAALLAALTYLCGFAIKAYQAIKRVETVMTWVTHEMRPNHGASLRDAVDRIELSQAGVTERLESGDARFAALTSDISGLQTDISRLQGQVSSIATIVCPETP